MNNLLNSKTNKVDKFEKISKGLFYYFVVFLVALCGFFIGDLSISNVFADNDASSTSSNETVNITVPSDMKIIFNSDESNTLPSNYTITNNSIYAINLDKVSLNGNNDWELLNSNFEIKNIKKDSKKLKFYVNDTLIQPKNSSNEIIDESSSGETDIPLDEDNNKTIEAYSSSNIDFKIERGAYSKDISTEKAFDMTLSFNVQEMSNTLDTGKNVNALIPDDTTQVEFVTENPGNPKDLDFELIDLSYKKDMGVVGWSEEKTDSNGTTNKIFKISSRREEKVIFAYDASRMFMGKSKISNIYFNNNADTSNTTLIYQFFKDCNSLEKIDVSSWDTSNFQNIDGLFSYCTSLKTIDVSNFKTERVGAFGGMFWHCDSLQEIKGLDKLNFDNHGYAITCHVLFANCYNLKELDLTNFNTNNINETWHNDVFRQMNKLEKVKIGSKLNWSNLNMKSNENNYLPTPSSYYIDNADGYWYDIETNERYTPETIPDNHAATYTAKRLTITYDALEDATNSSNNPSWIANGYDKDINIEPVSSNKTGYTFDGWTCSQLGITTPIKNIKFNSKSVNENIVLQANWTPITVTLNYHANGATQWNKIASGNKKDAIEITDELFRSTTYKYTDNYDDIYGLMDTDRLYKDGYQTNRYWYVDSENSSIKISDSLSIPKISNLLAIANKNTDAKKGNVTIDLYPKWSANTITLNYHSNGATLFDDPSRKDEDDFKNIEGIDIFNTQLFYYDKECNASSGLLDAYRLIKDGYSVDNYWYVGGIDSNIKIEQDQSLPYAQDLANASNMLEQFKNGNITIDLYPKWTINQYNLSVKLNGGTWGNGQEIQTLRQNYKSQLMLPTPIKEGYVFTGWKAVDNVNRKSVNIQKFGTPFYEDEQMLNSTNGIDQYLYNSGSNKNKIASNNNPINSKYVLDFTNYHNNGNISFGGFFQPNKSAIDGGIYYQVFIAKLPKGYKFFIGSNINRESVDFLNTNKNYGTGEWETYVVKYTLPNPLTSGNEGFNCYGPNGIGFYYIVGETGETYLNSDSVNFQVAYSNMFKCENESDFNNEYVTGLYTFTSEDQQIEATWKKKITITFDNQSMGTLADEDKTKVVLQGDTYGEFPKLQNYDNRIIEGWYTEPELGKGTKINSTDIVDSDSNITLYAHPMCEIDVNGDLNNGQTEGQVNYATFDIRIGNNLLQNTNDRNGYFKYGTEYEITNIKVKDGYEFVGTNGLPLKGKIGIDIYEPKKKTYIVLKFKTKT